MTLDADPLAWRIVAHDATGLVLPYFCKIVKMPPRGPLLYKRDPGECWKSWLMKRVFLGVLAAAVSVCRVR